MRFTNALPIVTLVLGVAAEPSVVARDAAAIITILNSVGAGITTLDTSIKAFSGDSTTLDQNSAALVTTIKNGAASASASGELSLTDSVGLATPVTALQPLGASLVADLIAKKSAFEAAGKCTDITNQVNAIQQQSNTLIKNILALVPADASALAASLAAPFQASLASGAAAYGPGKCVDVVGTTSTSQTTSSSTSSTSSTATSSVASTTSGSSSSTATSSAGSTTSAATTATLTTSTLTTSTSVSVPLGTGSLTPTTTPLTPFSSDGNARHGINSFGLIVVAAAALIL